MKIDSVLILSAGLGTRMGPVGKELPKVLWPVFEKSLLELQIMYAKELGLKNIYVNTHFLHEKVNTFLNEKFPEVTVLYEPTLLDVGGAIHNLNNLTKGRHQSLLVLNGDLLNFIPRNLLDEGASLLKRSNAILFGLSMLPHEKYNQLMVENGQLKDVIPSEKGTSRLTYSGVSLINLTKLRPHLGPSKFFETVASYKENHVAVLTPKVREYYDFGTVLRYQETHFEILGLQSGNAKEFLKRQGSFDERKAKISLKSYNSDRPEEICAGEVIISPSGVRYKEYFSPV